MMIFALFFCIFMSYRSQNVEFYRASQSTLNRGFGAINTVLLLTSSGFVVLALQTFRKRLFGKSSQLFSLTIVCGGGFAFVKLLEYYQKISAGITPATNDFYMFYFVF